VLSGYDAGPARLSVTQVPPGPGLTVYRIVRTDAEEDPAFLNSFRSHYELAADPRGVEHAWPVIHRGISGYLGEGAAHATAKRFNKLGSYIAQLRLDSGEAFNIAHTGPPQHLTIWADPVKLQEAVVDINAVWEGGPPWRTT